MIAGRTYLERGRPVTVVCGWGPGGGPRNVLIERADGTRVVRPFRGLRKLPRCDDAEPMWRRRCELATGHDGPHRNVQPGDTVTWGTVEQIRAYERGEEAS